MKNAPLSDYDIIQFSDGALPMLNPWTNFSTVVSNISSSLTFKRAMIDFWEEVYRKDFFAQGNKLNNMALSEAPTADGSSYGIAHTGAIFFEFTPSDVDTPENLELSINAPDAGVYSVRMLETTEDGSITSTDINLNASNDGAYSLSDLGDSFTKVVLIISNATEGPATDAESVIVTNATAAGLGDDEVVTTGGSGSNLVGSAKGDQDVAGCLVKLLK